MRQTVLLAILLAASGQLLGSAQTAPTQLKIEQVMTPQEVRDTGVSSLNAPQKVALNAWLNRYTQRVFQATVHQDRNTPTDATSTSPCAYAIESTISGDFEGWSGETVFKLDNGQIWEQAEYAYMYSYSYRPSVTIYPINSGCRMKVEDESETILVRRIK